MRNKNILTDEHEYEDFFLQNEPKYEEIFTIKKKKFFYNKKVKSFYEKK